MFHNAMMIMTIGKYVDDEHIGKERVVARVESLKQSLQHIFLLGKLDDVLIERVEG